MTARWPVRGFTGRITNAAGRPCLGESRQAPRLQGSGPRESPWQPSMGAPGALISTRACQLRIGNTPMGSRVEVSVSIAMLRVKARLMRSLGRFAAGKGPGPQRRHGVAPFGSALAFSGQMQRHGAPTKGCWRRLCDELHGPLWVARAPLSGFTSKVPECGVATPGDRCRAGSSVRWRTCPCVAAWTAGPHVGRR